MRDAAQKDMTSCVFDAQPLPAVAAGFTDEILFSSSCLRAWIYDEDMKDETTREMNLCSVCFL
jgi:hypothetical protein